MLQDWGLAGFPAETRTTNAELAAVTAAEELALAEHELTSVPPARGGPVLALLGAVRLLLAWFEGDLPMVVQQAYRLQDLSEAPGAAQPGRGKLRALALIGLGDTESWTGLPDLAELRLAQEDPQGAAAERAPVLDESARVGWRSWLVQAFLLVGFVQDALGDPAAAERVVERALDLAEPDGALLWFLLHPAPGLLERHAQRAPARAALITHILGLLWDARRNAGLPPVRSGNRSI